VEAAATRAAATDRVFFIPSGVTVILEKLTIRYGKAPAFSPGGGLYNQGTLTLTNSTVHGNATGHEGTGGGLVNEGTLTLINSTISGNAAVGGYGGGLVSGGVDTTLATLTNSIIANNVATLYTGDCFAYGGITITSHGYNLDSDGSCHLTAATDRSGVDPLLGPLQKNGGPTRTHALLAGSPTIDAIPWGTNGCGTTRYSDQRWQARPQPAGGACDIGASEVAVAGQALGGWVTGLTPHSVTC
jgi:hypothetical protein